VKLLFDQNLSQRLAAALEDLYAGWGHARQGGLSRS
jgi:predicted nuclease of predicted toxin-antitoxin system